MKKLLLSLSLLLTFSYSFCQSNWEKSNFENNEQELFTFDKLSIVRLEKESQIKKEDFINGNNLYLGAIILKNENDSLRSGKYIKLSAILSTDKFTSIATSPESGLRLLQNVTSKLFYVTNAPIYNFFDYSRSDENGFRTLIKVIPKPLTNKEKELLIRYKALIKKGQTNCAILQGIQRRCLTRGYFDERKMSKIDIQTWNKNLSALKITYQKLNDIDKYEDVDNHAQDKLSLSELGSLDNFNNWLFNYTKIE